MLKQLAATTIALIFSACTSPQAKAPAGSPREPARTSTVETWPTSTYGYKLAVPFHSLSSTEQDRLRRELPLESVGAVKTHAGPMRASGVYLGRFNGEYLFTSAEHVMDKQPYAIELGHLDSSKFSVPLLGAKPLFVSESGDMAVLKANRKALSADMRKRLDGMRPVRLCFEKLSVLLERHPEAEIYMPARSLYNAVLGALDDKDTPGMWPLDIQNVWKDPSAANEAALNLDERPTEGDRRGDVLSIVAYRPLSGGMTQALHDPDGLGKGEPFVKSRPGWKPVSFAKPVTSFPRNSGAPDLLKAGDGSVVMVGSNWTSGVWENLQSILAEAQNNPARVFGDVREQIENGESKLSLGLSGDGRPLTAPFSYSSAMEQAGSDMYELLQKPAKGLSATDRKTLRALYEASLGCMSLLTGK